MARDETEFRHEGNGPTLPSVTKIPIEHLSDATLQELARDLGLNVYYTHGQPTLVTDVVEHFQEAVEECSRRGLDCTPKRLAKRTDPPTVFYPNLEKVIRYGKKRHLEAFMQGTVSFGPSGCYSAAKVRAQRDDETCRTFRAPNQRITIGSIEYDASNIVLRSAMADAKGNVFPVHLLCAAYEESRKLCRAFHADGYVLIHDPDAFFRLVKKALAEYSPAIDFFRRKVEYYDQRAPKSLKLLDEMVCHKTISYAYQREVRYVVFDAPDTAVRFQVQISVPEGLFELRLFPSPNWSVSAVRAGERRGKARSCVNLRSGSGNGVSGRRGVPKALR
jgi:hypothetical protein